MSNSIEQQFNNDEHNLNEQIIPENLQNVIKLMNQPRGHMKCLFAPTGLVYLQNISLEDFKIFVRSYEEKFSADKLVESIGRMYLFEFGGTIQPNKNTVAMLNNYAQEKKAKRNENILETD